MSEKRTVLNATTILASVDIEVEWVPVPEWGDESSGLYVRGMTGTERDRFEESRMVGRGKKRKVSLKDARSELVVICAVDNADPAKAKPVFTRKHIEELSRKSAAPLQRLYTVAARLSGIIDDSDDEAVEDLKNDQSG